MRASAGERTAGRDPTESPAYLPQYNTQDDGMQAEVRTGTTDNRRVAAASNDL